MNAEQNLWDRRFLSGLAVVYAAVIVSLVLTINPYFSLGWDVQTFIAAGRSLFDAQDGPFDLYRQSRAAFYWPYAYPPLHALLVAPFLLLAGFLPFLPDAVLVRLPVVLFDLGLAWFLYDAILAATGRCHLARLAAILWLFNPVTLYQTAVQAHFESEWVLLVLLAYTRHGLPRPEATFKGGFLKGSLLAGALLAAAILIKQIAVIYAVPYWLWLWLAGRRREAFASGLLASALVALVCLPFALYSDDFLYMVTSYVSQMPVQTQSALVWFLLLKDYLVTSHTSSFFLLRYSTPIVAALSALVAAWGLRRGQDLFCIGLLVTVVFFLFSTKVMAYYYVIIIPFLLLVFLPGGRFGLLTLSFAALAWILLSPYYAPWAKQDHAWLYAALGTPNSLFLACLGLAAWRQRSGLQGKGWARGQDAATPAWGPGRLAGVVCALGLALAVPTFFQPAHAVDWVPGRRDLSLLMVGSGLLALTLLALWPLTRLISRLAGGSHHGWAYVAAGLYLPLTFSQFYLTTESTRVLELLLKEAGL